MRYGQVFKREECRIDMLIGETLMEKGTRFKDKLYNLIFPLWMIMFFPPFLIAVLFGNLVIDGLVIYLTLYLNRAMLERKQLINVIIKAWVFGFLADLAGAFILFIFSAIFSFNGYYAFESPAAALPFIVSVVFAGCLIGVFNYRQCRSLMDSRLAARVGLAMGIVTAPWVFFIPSSVMW
ncbi:hypothetical protein Pmgp_03682 [Pelotomaculum propionicicum]|uniref:Uncharacterized protein n=1 Tax=Pelotomaculum propionicicum TaxID=258475 RepID=A0A4Y7RIA1_9FIRM|nr:hypothetical protein Pmgp_03682 [Pelotomaculum propionicicum]